VNRSIFSKPSQTTGGHRFWRSLIVCVHLWLKRSEARLAGKFAGQEPVGLKK
jgi:hypothetical protein